MLGIGPFFLWYNFYLKALGLWAILALGVVSRLGGVPGLLLLFLGDILIVGWLSFSCEFFPPLALILCCPHEAKGTQPSGHQPYHAGRALGRSILVLLALMGGSLPLGFATIRLSAEFSSCLISRVSSILWDL